VRAIVELVLIDRQEVETVVDTGEYRLEKDLQRPKVRPIASLLPSVPNDGAVRVRFEAGFATVWGDLPSDLGQAVLLLAAHYYENRNNTGLGDGCMPFGVTSLIERYRTVRLFGGPGQ
jgi:uncharacterized phiE125 gp8 family phage protein